MAPSTSRPALLALLAAALAAPAAAQGPATSRPRDPLAPAMATVALLPAALYNEQANVQEPTDAAKAAVATEVLAAKLGELLGRRAILVDGGSGCNVRVACAREAARAAGAQWVVLSKVSKTSNLIWLLTGQLIHVPTGEIVLDDSTELKGEPEAMTRAGTRIFAERVARTVKRGGLVTDYPDGEPPYVGPNPAMTP
jgi:hypothetical protein